MAEEGDDVGRIVIRLVRSEPAEQALLEAYLARPRSRRQEWLRSVLAAGFASLQGMPVRAPVAIPAPAMAPQAPRHPQVAAPPSIPLSPMTGSAGAPLEPEESPAVLKGFFTTSATSTGGQPS